MVYIILFIVSFILMTIMGIISVTIAYAIFGVKTNIGSMVGGIFTAIATLVIIRYFYHEIYPKSVLTESNRLIILLPIFLSALRTLYVESVQKKTGNLTWGELPIKMKVNIYIPIGCIIGVIISFLI